MINKKVKDEVLKIVTHTFSNGLQKHQRLDWLMSKVIQAPGVVEVSLDTVAALAGSISFKE